MAFQFPALQLPRLWPRKATRPPTPCRGAARSGPLAALGRLYCRHPARHPDRTPRRLPPRRCGAGAHRIPAIHLRDDVYRPRRQVENAVAAARQGRAASHVRQRRRPEAIARKPRRIFRNRQTVVGRRARQATSSCRRLLHTLRGALDKLVQEWTKTEKNATIVVNETQTLLGLGAAVRNINGRNSTLSDLAEELAALTKASAPSTRHSIVAGEIMVLTQRIAKNANIMLGGDTIDPEVAFLLSKDTNTFRENLQTSDQRQGKSADFADYQSGGQSQTGRARSRVRGVSAQHHRDSRQLAGAG